MFEKVLGVLVTLCIVGMLCGLILVAAGNHTEATVLWSQTIVEDRLNPANYDMNLVGRGVMINATLLLITMFISAILAVYKKNPNGS